MNLAFDSRFVSFVVRVSDAHKRRDDDEDQATREVIDLTGGNFEVVPEFGFQPTEEEQDE